MNDFDREKAKPLSCRVCRKFFTSAQLRARNRAPAKDGTYGAFIQKMARHSQYQKRVL